MGGYRQTTTTENAKVEASLNLRFAESGTKKKARQKEKERKRTKEKARKKERKK